MEGCTCCSLRLAESGVLQTMSPLLLQSASQTHAQPTTSRSPLLFSHLQVANRVAFSYQQSDFVCPISEEQPGLGLHLTEQEQAMYLDLGPYVNPSYYVVQVSSSFGAVHLECMQYRS